jgi:hypothetical protein
VKVAVWGTPRVVAVAKAFAKDLEANVLATTFEAGEPSFEPEARIAVTLEDEAVELAMSRA